VSDAVTWAGIHAESRISHSSADRKVVSKLEKALGAAGLSVWLDDSDVTLGALLGKELQDSIRASHVLLLLWSEHAASSRWVASEWLTAFHLNRYIVPRGLDGTALPQCLQGSGSSHPDSRLPRAFHVLQLGRVHVLLEARDFPVSDLPYVADRAARPIPWRA
jgi:hypothetical protein